MYDEIFQAVKDLAETYAAPFSKIHHGPLPMDESLTMYPGPEAPDTTFLDRGSLSSMVIVFNGKSVDAATLVKTMSHIHRTLSLLKAPIELPGAATWSVYNIETVASPNFIKQEPSTKQWLYGSSLRIQFDTKGVN